jgi:hypothetical protein
MVANCCAIGRSSLDATKAFLIRIARAEGRRLRRAVSLDRFPFRVDDTDLFVPVRAALVGLDLDDAGLPCVALESDV